MFGGLGISELLVILAVLAILFGAGRIPKVAKSLGKAIKEFKKVGKEITNDVEQVALDRSEKMKD